MLQLGVRFYDPEIGRFTQVDLVETYRRSTYSYSADRPTMYVDPTGMYATRGNCAGGCPQLGEWIAEIGWRMYASNRCRQAIEKVGCASRLKPGFPGITMNCMKQPPGIGGTCQAANQIDIDCSKGGYPGTLLHEAVHSCFFASGLLPTPQGAFLCSCGAFWPSNLQADPYWESSAEEVTHACGY